MIICFTCTAPMMMLAVVGSSPLFAACNEKTIEHNFYIVFACVFSSLCYIHLEDVNAVEHDSIHPTQLLSEHQHQGDDEGCKVWAEN